MAVDTAAKRLSMLDWGELAGGFPLPDGGFSNQADRQHLLGLYNGILAVTGAATPLTSIDQTPIYWGSSVNRRPS